MTDNPEIKPGTNPPVLTNLSVDIDKLPKIADIDFHVIEKRWCYKQVCERLLGVIVVVAFGLWLIFQHIPHEFELGLYFLMAFIACRAFAWSFIEYPYKAYAVRDKDILFKSGVLWRSETVIAYNRIQHVELSHGIFDRLFHLADLEIYTAGGNASDLLIPGLDAERIELLRDFILEKASKTRE